MILEKNRLNTVIYGEKNCIFGEQTIPMRLGWLWFLGYDIDSEVADQRVLSKAQALQKNHDGGGPSVKEWLNPGESIQDGSGSRV